ncbi:MAG: PAS domain S-box protein [Acidobacteria bacterium]|nr:PAS domain S-box protein [Acidobacteriota bacterium]
MILALSAVGDPRAMQKDLESTIRKFAPRVDSQIRLGERVPTIFWSTDSNLRVLSVQGTGLALLNLKPDELKDVSLLDYFQRQDPDLRFIDAHRRALQGESSTFEATWGEQAFDAHIEPLRNPEGRIIGTMGVARELTSHWRSATGASVSEQRLRALIEHSSDMKVLVSADGTILYASPSTTRILGYPLEALVGRNAFELIHAEEQERVRNLLAELLGKPGGILNTEFRLQAKDGAWRCVEVSGHNLLADPGVGAVVVNYRDVTEQKKAEAALRRAEEKYRSIVENAVEGIFQTTPEGGYLSVNPALARMYGYASPVELMASVTDIGQQVYVDPRSRAEFKRLMEKEGVVEGFEYQVYRKDGNKLWLSENARAVRDSNGTILYYEGTVEEITARKRAEDERQVMFEITHGLNVTANLDELLHLIHLSLRKVLYAENCFVALYDRATCMFHFPFFVDQFDTAPPPMKVGRSCTAYVYRTGRPMLIPQRLFDQLVEQGEVELVGTPSPTWLGVPLRTPSETIGVLVLQHYEDERAYTERDLEFLASVGGQIALAIERKKAEAALRASENRLRAIISTEPECVKLVTPDGTLLEINPAGLAMCEADHPSEVIGKSVHELVCPEYREKFRQFIEQVCRGHKESMEFEFSGLKGTRRWMETYAVLLPNESDASPLVLAVTRDITERQRAEEALRRSEANYRSLVQGAPYGIYRVNAEGRLLDVNPALVEMLGYAAEAELLAVNFDTDVHRDPGERSRIIHSHPERIEGIEVGWKRKDGTAITVRLSGRPVRDADGAAACYEMIAENVTEQRLLEHQLRQAQKMEAVGRLAGGVAHDFNNLLMVIKGHTELLLDRVRTDDWHYRKIEQIEKAADRAVGLTRQLLAFSRMQVLQPKVIDLNAVVAEMGKLLPRLIGEDIELAFLTDPTLGRVKADPGQMEQVILNLAVNARDAMPRGGKFIIETSNVDLDEAYARRHPPLVAGSYVMLAVTDNGIGMDAETQVHIFEPFFTTKDKGKGTGLGLATVYGVVKQSGGYIWLYSEPGRGTTFKIYLPRVEELVEAGRPAPSSAESPQGTETILLAEDERDVREVAREFLGLSGYTVLEARNGAQAIEIATHHPGPIHLLVTDMVMPGMGGRELAGRLAPLRPEMKVVYMSGYTEYATVRQGELHENDVLLTKPFTRSLLARTVREVLRGGKVQ